MVETNLSRFQATHDHREVQHVLGADQQRRDLLPETPVEQRKPNHAIPHIRTCGERMLRVGKQDLVVIHAIDASEGINQFPRVPPDPDGEIFEMPGGNYNSHGLRHRR
jgi:hypothetical protein